MKRTVGGLVEWLRRPRNAALAALVVVVVGLAAWLLWPGPASLQQFQACVQERGYRVTSNEVLHPRAGVYLYNGGAATVVFDLQSPEDVNSAIAMEDAGNRYGSSYGGAPKEEQPYDSMLIFFNDDASPRLMADVRSCAAR